jgi:hypothetical protein
MLCANSVSNVEYSFKTVLPRQEQQPAYFFSTFKFFTPVISSAFTS